MKMDIQGIVLLGGDEPDHTTAWQRYQAFS